MQATQEQLPSHFDELMAAQGKLCDIQTAQLSGVIWVDPAEIDTARREYTQRLRANVWEIASTDAEQTERTFERVGAFLTHRMTEIVGCITETFRDDNTGYDAGEIRALDCLVEYGKLTRGENRDRLGQADAVVAIINDAVDVAVPTAMGKAIAQVRQLRADAPQTKPQFSFKRVA